MAMKSVLGLGQKIKVNDLSKGISQAQNQGLSTLSDAEIKLADQTIDASNQLRILASAEIKSEDAYLDDYSDEYAEENSVVNLL